MKRKLPEHNIEGTTFLVDIERGLLWQSDNAKNILSLEDMKYTDEGYKFVYDLTERSLHYALFHSGPTKEVTLPHLARLDPEGMAAKYKLPEEEIRNKTDYDIIVNKEVLAKRLNGQLPVVDIAGRDYQVNYQQRELKATDDSGTSIHLDKLSYFIEEELYRGFYDTTMHHLVDINPATITEIPQGLSMIEIPLDRKLDPVAFAQEEGLDMKAVLVQYPPEEKRSIPLIPIEQTNLPQVVKRNKGWEQQEKQQQEYQRKRSRTRRV